MHRTRKPIAPAGPGTGTRPEPLDRGHAHEQRELGAEDHGQPAPDGLGRRLGMGSRVVHLGVCHRRPGASDQHHWCTARTARCDPDQSTDHARRWVHGPCRVTDLLSTQDTETALGRQRRYRFGTALARALAFAMCFGASAFLSATPTLALSATCGPVSLTAGGVSPGSGTPTTTFTFTVTYTNSFGGIPSRARVQFQDLSQVTLPSSGGNTRNGVVYTRLDRRSRSGPGPTGSDSGPTGPGARPRPHRSRSRSRPPRRQSRRRRPRQSRRPRPSRRRSPRRSRHPGRRQRRRSTPKPTRHARPARPRNRAAKPTARPTARPASTATIGPTATPRVHRRTSPIPRASARARARPRARRRRRAGRRGRSAGWRRGWWIGTTWSFDGGGLAGMATHPLDGLVDHDLGWRAALPVPSPAVEGRGRSSGRRGTRRRRRRRRSRRRLRMPARCEPWTRRRRGRSAGRRCCRPCRRASSTSRPRRTPNARRSATDASGSAPSPTPSARSSSAGSTAATRSRSSIRTRGSCRSGRPTASRAGSHATRS